MSDFVYNTPCPQTLNPNAPAEQRLCHQSVNAFVYDPCNCDAGYWCGCSSTDPADCIPSNDPDSRWVGRFTTEDADGNEVLLTGSLQDATGESLACPDTTICLGYTNIGQCPGLCTQGSFCATSAEMATCPTGKYCPEGSVEPLDCPALTSCSSEGLYIYDSWPPAVITIVASVLVVLFLRISNRRLTARERLKREEMLAEREVAEGEEEEAGIAILRPSALPKIPLTLDLHFEDLQRTLPDGGPTILKGVSGHISKGEITAIMGPSGAGKSTFLSILSGKAPRTGGTLRINGEESEMSHYRRVIGFVPQEDVMIRELSVAEVIVHSAMMRLPLSWSTEDKLRKADETMELLGLTHIRDSIIGDELKRGISGGQRKRVNIGIEMVIDPALLCLDEPTSGLDSTSSMSVLNVLRRLADSGVNVLAVLHQPKNEIFELFDKVLFLGRGGRTVYLGPAKELANYFQPRGFTCPQKANPADYYMDVIAGIVPREGHKSFDADELFDMWEHAEENPMKREAKVYDHGEPPSADQAPLNSIPAASPTKASLRPEMAAGTASNMVGMAAKGGAMVTSPVVNYFRSWARWGKDMSEHLPRNFSKNGADLREVPGVWGQFRLCFKRAMLQRIRDPSFSSYPLLMELIAGLILGFAVNKDLWYVGIPLASNDSFLMREWATSNIDFMDLVPPTWDRLSLGIILVCVVGVEMLGNERANFFRESATGLHVSAYWAAKTLEALLVIPLYSLMYASLVWWLAPQLIPFPKMWMCVMLSHVGFYGISMYASIRYSQKNRAIIALVIGLVLSLAFSGATIAYDGIGIFWIFWVFWVGQGYTSAFYNELNPPFDTEQMNNVSTSPNPDACGYDLSSSFGRNMGLALLTGFAIHLIVLWALKVTHYKKQR
jgi:ABC-type multidrug transport system ATPase subunit